MKRRRVTYRPNKAQGALGVVFGVIFIAIGLFVVTPVFGPFGLLWTLMAVGITAANGYQAFGKKYIGPEIQIEEEDTQEERGEASPALGQGHDHIPTVALDARERLEQLENLKDAGLITQEEYQKKREEIVSRLCGLEDLQTGCMGDGTGE